MTGWSLEFLSSLTRRGQLHTVPMNISHLTHLANKSYSFRVVTSSHDPAFQQSMSEKLDEHFRAQGYKLEEAQTGSATLKTASESSGYPGYIPFDHGYPDCFGRKYRPYRYHEYECNGADA